MTSKYKQLSIDKIKPYEGNPRVITSAAVDAVAKSIQTFGFRQPIVVDSSYTILAGHTRYLAAKQLNLTDVPVVIQEDISEIQARGYRIADNKTAEISSWDKGLLQSELKDLAQISDFDLTSLAIPAYEIESLLHDSEETVQKALDSLEEALIAGTSGTPKESKSEPQNVKTTAIRTPPPLRFLVTLRGDTPTDEKVRVLEGIRQYLQDAGGTLEEL